MIRRLSPIPAHPAWPTEAHMPIAAVTGGCAARPAEPEPRACTRANDLYRLGTPQPDAAATTKSAIRISQVSRQRRGQAPVSCFVAMRAAPAADGLRVRPVGSSRSEEHTSELQSP